MDAGALGKVYQDGEVIVRQGAVGGSMYVIQEGQVEVVIERNGDEVQLGLQGEGDFFGEMAIFDREVRSATVRALGPVRALTVDRRNFPHGIHSDPSLAFRIVETLSRRVRRLDAEVARLERLVRERR
jgi:CRP-like cAMP-binding protein